MIIFESKVCKKTGIARVQKKTYPTESKKIHMFSIEASRISQLSGLTAKSFEQLLLAAINLLKSNWMTGIEIR